MTCRDRATTTTTPSLAVTEPETGARKRAGVIVDALIDESIRTGLNFGMEIAASGPPGQYIVECVERVLNRVEGLCRGTSAASSLRTRSRCPACPGYSQAMGALALRRWGPERNEGIGP